MKKSSILAKLMRGTSYHFWQNWRFCEMFKDFVKMLKIALNLYKDKLFWFLSIFRKILKYWKIVNLCQIDKVFAIFKKMDDFFENFKDCVHILKTALNVYKDKLLWFLAFCESFWNIEKIVIFGQNDRGYLLRFWNMFRYAQNGFKCL